MNERSGLKLKSKLSTINAISDLCFFIYLAYTFSFLNKKQCSIFSGKNVKCVKLYSNLIFAFPGNILAYCLLHVR